MAKNKKKKKVGLLKEGESYEFEIKKLIRLSDGLNYYILTDPFEKNHLMFDRYYIHYGMKTGDIIVCLIDKINCNGKIFLEPKHPFYEISKKYEFKFKGISEVENSKKKKIKVLLVDDKYNSIAEIINVDKELYTNYLSKKVIARIDKIKKGRLFLLIEGH